MKNMKEQKKNETEYETEEKFKNLEFLWADNRLNCKPALFAGRQQL